jgi:hypothetical protein
MRDFQFDSIARGGGQAGIDGRVVLSFGRSFF